MNIYNYHPTTKEYLGKSKADPDPLEQGRWLIPAYATTIAPPVAGENEVATISDNTWDLEPDFRGTKFWVDHETSFEIEEIGNAVPQDAFLTQPDPPPPTPEEVAEQLRREEIKAAKSAAGMKELSVDQAQAYITNQLDTTALDATGVDIDNATDLATAKAAFKSSIIELRKLVVAEQEVLLKMIPYIL